MVTGNCLRTGCKNPSEFVWEVEKEKIPSGILEQMEICCCPNCYKIIKEDFYNVNRPVKEGASAQMIRKKFLHLIQEEEQS